MQKLMITVTGLTPAVVTETLWAVLHEPAGADALPDKIIIVTTADGKRKMQADLLGPTGALARFCAAFQIDPVIPAEIRVVATADGAEIDDIRSAEDSIAAADAIVHAVRDIVTTWPEATIHASLAGGRKTMSFHLGYAMSLFGKEGDRLTHVLVNPAEFEVPGFHFIPPDRGILEVADRTRETGVRRLDTAHARIDLADIPFIRLRPHLKGDLRRNILESKTRISHDDIVRGYQVSLSGIDALTLDDATCSVGVVAGKDRWEIALPPRAYALYRLYAAARKAGEPAGTDPQHAGWLQTMDVQDTRKLGSGTSMIEVLTALTRRLIDHRETSDDAGLHKQSAIQQDRQALATLTELIDEAQQAMHADAGNLDRQERVKDRFTDLFSKERKKVNDRLKDDLKHEGVYRHVEIAGVSRSRNGLRVDGSRVHIRALPGV